MTFVILKNKNFLNKIVINHKSNSIYENSKVEHGGVKKVLTNYFKWKFQLCTLYCNNHNQVL